MTVFAVVDAAPAEVTVRYDVRALRPRSPLAASFVVLKGRRVAAVDIRWSARPSRRGRGVCDLTLHVPGWVDALPAESLANQASAEQVFLLLDHGVGEWAVET